MLFFHGADDSTTCQYGGTGLGLVIAEQIVEMMGGEIELRQRARSARRFCSTVLALALLGRAEKYRYVPDLALAARTARVLLAEDNPVNALVAEEMFRVVWACWRVVLGDQRAAAVEASSEQDAISMSCSWIARCR